ncbi:hypothetical protein ABZ464_27895 [Streptomyces sp. NPDC005820]
MPDDREPPETALEAVLREIEDAEARADELDHLGAATTSDMPEIHWDE